MEEEKGKRLSFQTALTKTVTKEKNEGIEGKSVK
jgi:hypothetical protein